MKRNDHILMSTWLPAIQMLASDPIHHSILGVSPGSPPPPSNANQDLHLSSSFVPLRKDPLFRGLQSYTEKSGQRELPKSSLEVTGKGYCFFFKGGHVIAKLLRGHVRVFCPQGNFMTCGLLHPSALPDVWLPWSVSISLKMRCLG